MESDRLPRKLAAILYADVAEYSRLTGENEDATHRVLSNYLDLISATVEHHRGRVMHYAGDAALAIFEAVVDAVTSAMDIQAQLRECNRQLPDERKVQFRIGVNMGDVIEDRGDVYGDGVNVAARLEGLAEPGGICVSGSVFEQVNGKLTVSFQNMGPQKVKNIGRPITAYRVILDTLTTGETSGDFSGTSSQKIHFCTAPDGVQLAYAVVGQGPPLVKTANWLNHLEYDWESPIWRHVLYALAKENLLIRYDHRGNGLSDLDVKDISFDAWVSDFETLVDALDLERFPIFAISQGCSVAIAYAVRHPERVSRLVLYGGYLRGRKHRGSRTEIEQEEAMLALVKSGWGQENPAFRQIFTSLFVPDATAEQMQWFNDLQRITTTPENAYRIRQAQNEIEVSGLADRVSVPTLVIHVQNDAIVPFEEGRRMAAMIPDARFVSLEGRNHLILEDEPAWPRFLEEVTSFLKEDENA
jgi:class 3 adenylate cyclase/pimeloyl-ACP methyl ester carboxylesterase